jgi:hypothetical protein
VAGSRKYGDEPSGSGAAALVRFMLPCLLKGASTGSILTE